jgi:hypothetical protein
MKLDLTAFAGAAVFPGTLADELLVCEGIICDRIDDAEMKAGVAFGAHAGARFGAFSVEGTLAYAVRGEPPLHDSFGQPSDGGVCRHWGWGEDPFSE